MCKTEQPQWRCALSRSFLIFLFLFLSGCASAISPESEKFEIVLRTEIDGGKRKVYVARYEMPSGAVSQRHIHPGDELFYVIEGEAEVRFDDGSARRLTKGEALHIAANVPHVDANPGGKPVIVVGFVFARPGDMNTYPAPYSK